MPLPLPVLDDRPFSSLVGLLRDLIPGETSRWDDFNASDPGITLVEAWAAIAEQLLYRIDLVPARSETNFLKLLLDPAQPVTAEVTIRLAPQFAPVEIPPGVRFEATVVSPPQTLVFETWQTTRAPVFPSPPEELTLVLSVRSRVVVENEPLGLSTGEPNQIFQISDGPVLVDDQNTGTAPGSYNPNPVIRVDGMAWQFVPDFLDPATGPASPHFLVEKRTGRVRFGNGLVGMIPPRGARIVADRYQVIRGREVRIDGDTLVPTDPLPGIAPGDVLDIRNAPAEGGEFIYPIAELESTGLRLFAEESRAITDEDVTIELVDQFNRQQDSAVSAAPPELVQRAFVVPNQDLRSGPPFAAQPGVLSVVILPAPAAPGGVAFTPSARLCEQFRRFLDRRRLITTRVYVVGPRPVAVSIAVQVSPDPGVDVPQLHDAVKGRLLAFFHPLTGGDEGNGWPVGRDVYRSEIFQQVEDVTGVDYVVSVAINGSTAVTRLPLHEIELPDVSVSVPV